MEFAKRTATALLAVIAAAGLGACNKARTEARAANTPDASAQVIGVKPAEPSAPNSQPPGVTPVAPNTTTITKQEESTQKPQEGDDHSYSSVSPDNPQKGDHKTDAQQLPGRATQ
jgi:hypothetical protein